MLTSNVAEAYGFVRSRPELELPDLELLFAPAPFFNEGIGDPYEGHAVAMGPVLLKPQSQIGAQIVVQGKVHGTAKAVEYMGMKQKLLPYVIESFEKMKAEADRGEDVDQLIRFIEASERGVIK